MLEIKQTSSASGNVQKSPSSPVLSRVEGKAAALLTRGAYSIVREHGKMATCLREAASAGMEPLACQP